jgi:sugar-specific transcriptional regulator TrmB
MDEREAVDALTELGLSSYEARVFIALVELGSGTAREVAEFSDVPRPQVYTTAKDLEARGFISIQQSNPQVFRPVSLAEAKSQLEHRFESKRDAAFDRLETLERQTVPPSDQSEDVWSITGETAIAERIVQLVKEADERVVYGAADLADPDDELLGELGGCCDRGVEAVLLREYDQNLPQPWTTVDCLTDVRLPAENQSNEYARRMLIVDDDVFLLSIRGSENASEIAIWSAHTTFAAVFCQLLLGSFSELD